MAVQVCLSGILAAQGGNLVLLGDQPLSVRIIRCQILLMGVAGIPHCKMRSHLLRDQDRQLVSDSVFRREHIGRGVCADGKFPHGKGIMMEQHIFPDELPAFRRIVKVSAGIV